VASPSPRLSFEQKIPQYTIQQSNKMDPAFPQSPQSQSSVFVIDISKHVGNDFAPMANDFVRMLCIQVAIQVLMTSGGGPGIFSAEFLMLLFYIAIGVLLYWAVVRKIISFM
jgi:hypothetical protein